MGAIIASQVLAGIVKAKIVREPLFMSKEHIDKCPGCQNVVDDTVKAVIEFIKTELGIDLHKIRI